MKLRLLIFALCLLSLPAWGATYYVATTGSDSNPGSLSQPWLTIQHAANSIASGDTVNVEAGTYNFASFLNIPTPGIFQCVTQWACTLQLASGVSPGVSINASNVTFQNFEEIGASDGSNSTGVKCNSGNACNVSGNKIHHIGTTTGACPLGAAIEPNNGNNEIVNANLIYDVSPPRTAARCNHEQGIYASGGTYTGGKITNNVILECYQCYGIQFDGGAPSTWTVANNTLANVGQGSPNNAGGGIYFNCATSGVTCDNMIFNNNIFMNVGGDSCITEATVATGGTNGTHNSYSNDLFNNCFGGNNFIHGALTSPVNANPLFVNYTGDQTGNYDLQSTSPAINAGTATGAPATDFQGNTRSGGIWIGAYQNTSSIFPPTVTTTTATSITATTAQSGGTVTATGGASVTSEGVCYALTANPTTPCTSNGTATPFTSPLSGLSPNTLYHYRAFATNSAGTGYGADQTFSTLPSASSQCPAPSYSCFSTSLATIPNGATPNVGNLTGAGTTFVDPNFGAVEMRGTDSTFETSILANASMNVAASGSGDQNNWGLNDDRLVISDSGGRNFVSRVTWGSSLARMYVGNGACTSGLWTTNGGLFFGHNANNPYRLYSYGNGGIGASSGFGPKIGYFDVTSTSTCPSFTQLYDLTSDLNTAVGGTFGPVTWTADGESDQTDTDFIEGLSNSGGQAGAGACYVAVYRQGSGARVLNFCNTTTTITGGWGPTGAASLNIPNTCKIHNVKAYKAGGTQGSVIIVLDPSPPCVAGGYEWFYTGNTITQQAPTNTSGHFTEGQTEYVNQAGNAIPNYWVGRQNTNPSSTTGLTASLPAAGSPGSVIDWHCGWNFLDDTYPFGCTTWSTTAIAYGWQNEVDFVKPSLANPIRVAQTYNSSQDPSNFSAEIAVGSVSQSGNYFAYTSDWLGTLGSTSGGATCTLTTTCRSDVFLVQLNVATTAATPTFSPAAGTYTRPLVVTPNTTTSGAIICYNTTGSPKTNRVSGCAPGSTLLTGGITLTASATVYAVAGGGGHTDSSVGSATYTINNTAVSPTFSPAAGTYVGTQNVTLSTTAGSVICYNTTGSPATNGSTGCTTGSKYTTPVAVSVNETLYAVAGGTGYADSPVSSAAYVIKVAAATPTFSPIAGTYTGTQSVAISTTSGLVICYNTTGSPATNGGAGCTTGSLYSGPVSVSASETLYAVAGGTGYTDSPVGSAAYTIVSGAAIPTFSPVAGTYTGTQSVTISTTSGGAIICYNTTGAPKTNGTTGCTTGTKYTAPVSVSSSETLYAVAGGTGFSDSTVGSATYTILTAASTPTFSPVAGTYTGTQSVTISSTSPGATICYNTTGAPATNGGGGCSVGILYTAPVSVSTAETLYAVAGGTGYSDSSVGSAAYVIKFPAATPTFSPVAGTYASTQTVTISTTSGGVICYTTNGTTPATNGTSGCTTGSLYSTPVSVSVSETLKAIAGGTGYIDSSVGSAAYVIRTSASTPTFSPVAGSYTGAQSVTISTTTGTVICYTTDGSTPATNGGTGCTAGTLYSSPVSVAVSETLKAIAGGSIYNDSGVGSVAYTIKYNASTPTFSPGAGTYSGTQSVTIASTGGVICYTTNGTSPATNGTSGCTTGTLYSTPVTVSSSLTLKAVGGGTGFNDSSVGSAAYVINTGAATPTFSPLAGTYASTQTVSLSTTSSGAVICWNTTGSPKTNGVTGCLSGVVYTGAITVSSSETIYAVAGGTGYNDSSVGSAAYVIRTTAATPTFSPVAGSYTGNQSVTISTTSGSVICYNTTGSPATNGGSGCTTGTLYSGPVTVSASETLYAVAGGSIYNDSSVGSAAYTIKFNASTPTFSPVAGTYTGTQTVTISSTGGVICYNTTGSPATNGSSGCTTGTLYSGPVTVSTSETLYAVGGGTGFNDSAVATAPYVIRTGAATPTFSPVAGTYAGTQLVSLTSTSSGAIICWNTSGSPATNGTTGCNTGNLYNGSPITVSSSETVYAVAGGTGFVDSSVGSAAYVIEAAASTPTFSPAAGSYGSTQSVTITAATGGVICYNTTGSPKTNGTSGCSVGTLYTGAVSVATSETLYAVAGGTGYFDSPVGSAAYVISTIAATPTFNPPAGNYASTQSVTIASTSAGAIICWNFTGAPATNGSSGCTTGTLYSGPVSVPSSSTLFAVAGGTGFTDSAVGSAVYVIAPNPPTGLNISGNGIVSGSGVVQ